LAVFLGADFLEGDVLDLAFLPPAALPFTLLRPFRSFSNSFFWTFRYYPSFFGVPVVADRAILVPTAEEDLIVTLDILERFFRQPAGYLFMTPEEKALVTARAGSPPSASATIGIGIEHREPPADWRSILAASEVPPEFLLYLGRVDRNKGCDTLLEYFLDYAASNPDVSLVLAGPAKMQVPAHPRIRALGYVSDELRSALLAGAMALVVPSPYESLSIVLLEGWDSGRPALVNASCKVLRGQVQRANGGLYYRSNREFNEAIDYFRSHPAERAALGRAGSDYVDREYRWPTVLARVETLLADVRARWDSA
jgi:glycosyltransferase involved in cell wall biosynthesis